MIFPSFFERLIILFRVAKLSYYLFCLKIRSQNMTKRRYPFLMNSFPHYPYFGKYNRIFIKLLRRFVFVVHEVGVRWGGGWCRVCDGEAAQLE